MAVRTAPATPPPTACPTTWPMSTLPAAPLKDRQERGEERPTRAAADRAGSSVTECAEVDVLEASTYGVTTNRTSDELDNQIDNRSRHSLSPLPVVVCFAFSLRSYCHNGVGRTRHACGVLRLSRLPTQQRTQGQGRDADDPAIGVHDALLALITQRIASRRLPPPGGHGALLREKSQTLKTLRLDCGREP